MRQAYQKWKVYVENISRFRDESQYSALWATFIKGFILHAGDFKDVDSFIQTNCRGYSFQRRPEKWPILKEKCGIGLWVCFGESRFLLAKNNRLFEG